MGTREYMLEELKKRIKEKYGSPKEYCWAQRERVNFLQKSYSAWAAEEFFSYLKGEDNLLEAGSIFIKVMDNFSCHEKNGWMFSVAHDVATDLLDYMYTLYWEV